MDDEQEAIERIYQALIAGELGDADLSARKIASFLGKTTGAIYHRWGSFDGLLFAVSQRGFADLGVVLATAWARKSDMADCAEAFVDFGLRHPGLYPLMFDHRFDWAALRAGGSFERATPGSELLASVVCLLGEAGSKTPLGDTRVLMAGLHGIVSFAASGRMNTGELGSPDRVVAIKSARHLAARVCPTSPAKTSPKKRART
jgi:AcrR family transcriptional regulator